MTIQQVLCPIDLSDASRQALDHAVTLARWYDAKTTILHVDDAAAGIAAQSGAAVASVRSPSALADEVRRFCEPWTSRVENAEVVLSSGNIVNEITDLSETLPADLLVLGTHGRSGFERLWLGSVSERVLRRVRRPVLTVPPHTRLHGSEIVFKSILCPIDFSDSSLRALEYAFSIAEETLASLMLMHVVEPLAEIAFKDGSAAFGVPEYEDLLVEDATTRLKALIPDDARSWCQPEEVVVKGKPYREILRRAADAGVQLIVMGVHGRSAFDLALFGSAAHHVVRAATCPVLTVRAP